MTTFWREGFMRYSSLGTPHWVEGHWVNRDSWWSAWPYEAAVSPSSTTVTDRPGTWIDPSARCPICGAEIFFYSNDFGSRVYFDDLGWPWPKHPCMDTSDSAQRVRGSTSGPGGGVRKLLVAESVPEGLEIPDVFVVLDVERRGPKRLVTMQEVGGERFKILISPPAPPAHSIAVARGPEIHWFDPRSGGHGRNLVWRAS